MTRINSPKSNYSLVISGEVLLKVSELQRLLRFVTTDPEVISLTVRDAQELLDEISGALPRIENAITYERAEKDVILGRLTAQQRLSAPEQLSFPNVH